MPTPSPSNESSYVSQAESNLVTTPAQREAAFGQTAAVPTFGFGIVRECSDSGKSGTIQVQSDIFGDKTLPCAYVSPVGGGGAGLFAVPGIGATVLVATIPSKNPPVTNVWMGCLYPAGQMTPKSFISQPFAKTDVEVAKNEVPEYTPPRGVSNAATAGAGCPDEDTIYADNNLPNSYVFKHPAGHSLRMTKKITPERNQDEIVIRTALGKRLCLSDAPASFGGNSLQLLDSDNNGLSIYTQTPEPVIQVETVGDINTISRAGDINNTIGAAAKGKKIRLTNGSSNGHIGVSGLGINGTIDLTATKSITLSVGNSKITIASEKISIDTPNIQITGQQGSEMSLGGVTFSNHSHLTTMNVPADGIAISSTGTGTGTGNLGLPVATTVETTGGNSNDFSTQGYASAPLNADPTPDNFDPPIQPETA